MTKPVLDDARPRSLLFEVTYECNHHCLHCYNVWRTPRAYPGGAMTFDETCSLFERLVAENGIEQVTLTGGEPLLYPELPTLVDHLRGLGLHLNLISNGALLDDAMIECLRPNKIDIFELPLLSVNRAVHDELSVSPGAFDRVTRAMVELKAVGQRVIAVFVATRLNLADFERTLELAFAIGCDGVMFNRFNPGGTGLIHRQRLEATPAEIQTALDQAEAFAREYQFAISCGVPMPPCVFDLAKYQRLTFGHCGAGTARSYYTVDPVGRLRPCNHSPTILGDLKRQALTEILAGAALERFVAALPEECAGCRIASECRGGCKAVAEQSCGAPDVLDGWVRLHGSKGRVELVEGRLPRSK
jgi:radical SAM protein with 4Fe4S-binding SPASM domain